MASEVCPLWATDAWVDMWSGFRYPLQEVQTLPKKIQNVFALNQKLDFPLITDICEAAEKRPYEIAESVHLLSQSLREGAGSKLKVVTLLNEMLYSMHFVYCVNQDRNLLQMLRRLQQKGAPLMSGLIGTSSASSSGAAAPSSGGRTAGGGEGAAAGGSPTFSHLETARALENRIEEELKNNIRMFSCEIEKKVRQDARNAVAPPRIKPKNIDITFAREARVAGSSAGGTSAVGGGAGGGGGFGTSKEQGAMPMPHGASANFQQQQPPPHAAAASQPFAGQPSQQFGAHQTAVAPQGLMPVPPHHQPPDQSASAVETTAAQSSPPTPAFTGQSSAFSEAQVEQQSPAFGAQRQPPEDVQRGSEASIGSNASAIANAASPRPRPPPIATGAGDVPVENNVTGSLQQQPPVPIEPSQPQHQAGEPLAREEPPPAFLKAFEVPSESTPQNLAKGAALADLF
eukprot:g11963.t1